LELECLEWIDKKGPPQKPDAAFIVFCRNKTARGNRQRSEKLKRNGSFTPRACS